MTMMRPAVFLDRDGTIIDDVGYLDDPAKVRLLPGAAEAIAKIRSRGYLAVVVSNQSGVARGLFDEATLARVHARMVQLLRQRAAELDGVYYCPFLNGEAATIDAFRMDSPLRKPEPGMLLQAAEELNIDLSRSWMIGDAERDVEAGARAGCRTILIQKNGREQATGGSVTLWVHSLAEAADRLESALVNPQPPVSESSVRLSVAATSATQPVVAPRSASKSTPGLLAAGTSSAHTLGPSQLSMPIAEPEINDAANSERAESVELLRRIHDVLDRQQRSQKQHDFSVLRLAGALLQMFAVVTALWGLMAIADDQSAAATARFSLACFTQIASISAFAIDRFR
ncbi:MAG: HAD family hydrolase [Planctomycetes bacterium]|nr:HAD family hydrolase [Planctomycetota bacterium]MBI3832918.1 HAD family hydrolase [Planctomycetota bacterium]